MWSLEIIGAFFLIGLGIAYPAVFQRVRLKPGCLNSPQKKEDMRRYGAIDTPPYLNPPEPRP